MPMRPRGRRRRVPIRAAWVTAALDDVEAAGVALARGFPIGRHVVDAVIDDVDGSGADVVPVAFVFGVHRDGAEAHIDRHLTLLDAGWRVVEVREPEWRDRHAELVVELIRQSRVP